MSTTSERLKMLLEMYNITQSDFIAKTGLPKSTVSQYMNGKRLPKQNVLTLIAQKYNVQEAWLMGFDVPMNLSDAVSSSDPKLIARLMMDNRAKKLIDIYFKLSLEGQEKLIDYADYLSGKEKDAVT